MSDTRGLVEAIGALWGGAITTMAAARINCRSRGGVWWPEATVSISQASIWCGNRKAMRLTHGLIVLPVFGAKRGQSAASAWRIHVSH